MKSKKNSSLTINRRKWRKRKRKVFVSTDAINRTHFKPKDTISQNNLIVVTQSQFPISPFTAKKQNRSPLISPLTREKVETSKKRKWAPLRSPLNKATVKMSPLSTLTFKEKEQKNKNYTMSLFGSDESEILRSKKNYILE